jgi:hypothetical protein
VIVLKDRREAVVTDEKPRKSGTRVDYRLSFGSVDGGWYWASEIWVVK